MEQINNLSKLFIHNAAQMLNVTEMTQHGFQVIFHSKMSVTEILNESGSKAESEVFPSPTISVIECFVKSTTFYF